MLKIEKEPTERVDTSYSKRNTKRGMIKKE